MGKRIPESPEVRATVGVATNAEAERAEGLSARQREVLELVAACLEEAELADSAPYRARASSDSAEVLDGEARHAH